MATSSTAPAVCTALVSTVATALATAGAGGGAVQVKDGRPPDNLLERECVYVGADIRGSDRVPVMTAGRKRREESYSIECVVAVMTPRGTLGAAKARAFVLLAEIEDAVADDPTLGGVDGLVHATAGEWEMTADHTTEGPVCLIRFEVDCLARLI